MLSSLSIQPAWMSSFTQSDGFDRCGQVDAHLPGRREWGVGGQQAEKGKGQESPHLLPTTWGGRYAWPVLTQESPVALLCPQVLQIPGESGLAFTLGPFLPSSCLDPGIAPKADLPGSPFPSSLGRQWQVDLRMNVLAFQVLGETCPFIPQTTIKGPRAQCPPVRGRDGPGTLGLGPDFPLL